MTNSVNPSECQVSLLERKGLCHIPVLLVSERKKERNSGEERNTASTQDGSHGENSYLNQLANIHLIERGVDSSFR